MLKTKFFHILNDELIERERERKKFSHQNEKKNIFIFGEMIRKKEEKSESKSYHHF